MFNDLKFFSMHKMQPIHCYISIWFDSVYMSFHNILIHFLPVRLMCISNRWQSFTQIQTFKTYTHNSFCRQTPIRSLDFIFLFILVNSLYSRCFKSKMHRFQNDFDSLSQKYTQSPPLIFFIYGRKKKKNRRVKT